MGYQYLGSEKHKRNALIASKLGSAALMKQRQARIEQYNKNPKLCENCSRPVEYDKRANRFCTRSCAGFFNGKSRKPHTAETRKKIADGNKRFRRRCIEEGVNVAPTVQKSCLRCSKVFVVKVSRIKKFCSKECQIKFQTTDPEFLRRASERGQKNIVKQMRAGKWKGWSGVGEGKRSYPESYIERKLKQDGFSYEFQYQVGRYKVDFAFLDKKLALEVDGKQHLREKQLQSDRRKDAFLEENGWTVFRLPWTSIKKESGRAQVEQRYQEFKNLLQSM